MINAHKVLTLIFDKGFWDGKTLYKLKYKYGIDFIVPAKTDFISTKRLKKEAKEEDFKTINPGLKIKQVSALTDAPNYKGHLNAIVVKDKKSKKKRQKNQPVHVYFTSLSWESALAIYQAYRQRWAIENNAIKELCQYWILEDFHCKKYTAIRAHIIFSIIMFNLHILFKSKYGRRFKEKSLAAKRAPGFQPSYVIVYAQEYFSIYDIHEYAAIISEPP